MNEAIWRPPKKHTNHQDGHPALFVRQTSALATFQRRKDRYRPSFGVPTQAACDEGRRLPARVPLRHVG